MTSSASLKSTAVRRETANDSLHFTPDGRFGFTPERDQDTVSRIDLATRRVVQTVEFPAGSKPYMLRVSPDSISTSSK